MCVAGEVQGWEVRPKGLGSGCGQGHYVKFPNHKNTMSKKNKLKLHANKHNMIYVLAYIYT